MENNKKKGKELELELEVSSGAIGRATQYKYTGDMYDKKGTNESKIKFKEQKISYMLADIIRESNPKKIGRSALPVRIMLIEIVITPTILSSTETWHNITKTEQQLITKIHHSILTKALHIPKTTPYKGIISELNIFPFTDSIWLKKYMWFHKLLHSDDSRIVKQMLIEDMDGTDNWYTEIQQYAMENEINIQIQFRKIVKTR